MESSLIPSSTPLLILRLSRRLYGSLSFRILFLSLPLAHIPPLSSSLSLLSLPSPSLLSSSPSLSTQTPSSYQFLLNSPPAEPNLCLFLTLSLETALQLFSLDLSSPDSPTSPREETKTQLIFPKRDIASHSELAKSAPELSLFGWRALESPASAAGHAKKAAHAPPSSPSVSKRESTLDRTRPPSTLLALHYHCNCHPGCHPIIIHPHHSRALSLPLHPLPIPTTTPPSPARPSHICPARKSLPPPPPPPSHACLTCLSVHALPNSDKPKQPFESFLRALVFLLNLSPRPFLDSDMSLSQDQMLPAGSDLVEGLDHLKVGDDEPRLGPDGEPAPKTEEEYAQAQLTLRAIVSSKEAGVIIGKGGKNVADLREETGVKAGVSKVVQGVHDRVLTITGGCDPVSKAYAVVARSLLEGAPAMGMGGVIQGNGTHPLKLLISHNQMGTIIGRQGLKIKHIQDASGVRMVAQKEMLPQSTERIVEVQGTPEGIQRAVWEICKCLVDDWQRGTGTVLYNPVVRTQPGATGSSLGGGVSYGSPSRGDYGSPRVTRTGNGADFSNGGPRSFNRRSDSDAATRGVPTHDENGEEIQTQNISIPADMVGCIIGRAGSKISEIRKTSGARISIAKAPHDETGERMFTIMGSAKANETALFLLYENLEAEKMRRSQAQASSE
ncbi:uncharacterized protein E0L32_012157 [Thyridium curvatum]|uniref:K Homology domain-containing protein n=1 Tax=Thyridium curvatum TaxID=1093900 RepID=A0A507BJX4_9PEZI|nr:uncharacterized protein E0L32_012157 [Thyridium curvatum]TPX17371.1 hypothetical protein E0L32_012157 [Thyridium curvatum]